MIYWKIISFNNLLSTSPWASHLACLSQFSIGQETICRLGSLLNLVLICGPLYFFHTSVSQHHISLRKFGELRQEFMLKGENLLSRIQMNHHLDHFFLKLSWDCTTVLMEGKGRDWPWHDQCKRLEPSYRDTSLADDLLLFSGNQNILSFRVVILRERTLIC